MRTGDASSRHQQTVRLYRHHTAVRNAVGLDVKMRLFIVALVVNIHVEGRRGNGVLCVVTLQHILCGDGVLAHQAAAFPDAQLRSGQLTAETAERIAPDRATLGRVWRYLASFDRPIQESPVCLCRKIVRWSDAPLSLEQMLTCLDIFRDVGLLSYTRHHKYMIITLTQGCEKADLSASQTMQTLLRAKES